MIIDNFNNFDYIITSTIAVSAIFAIVKGFVKSIISIAGWILNICITYNAHYVLKPFLKKFIDNSFGQTLASMLISFLLGIIFSSFCTSKLYKMTENARGGFFDRSLGAIFGVIRGFLVCYIIVLATTGVYKVFLHSKDSDDALPNFLSDSITYPIFKKYNQLITNYMPHSIKSEIDKIGSYKTKDNNNNNDDQIGKIIDKFSPSLTSLISSEYLNKLKNKQVSDNEKYKILELIYKMNESNPENYEINKMIEEVLDNIKNSNTKQSQNKNNQLQYLIESSK